MAEIRFPATAKNRGVGYWLRPGNAIAARRKLRPDFSNQWRYVFGEPQPADRSLPFTRLLEPDRLRPEGFRFIIIGDTGEGDHSQYGLIPVIRALRPDFMLIVGDIAYPAGRLSATDADDDYICGLFEPYKNLGCPIWGVPGNHEYYAEGRGREFYDIFCSQAYARRWAAYGLRFVPQPGMYWELQDAERRNDLVVIGIDTGQVANLDGTGKKWWQPWKRHHPGDAEQLLWLDRRLQKAEARGHRVILLYHIPALVNEQHVKKTHLQGLHQLIAAYPCVKLVVCGHEHNYQHYTPASFQRYLHEQHQASGVNREVRYIVAGGGGAYLTSTAFKRGQYHTDFLYPSPDEWRQLAGLGRRLVERSGLSKSPWGRIAGMCEDSTLADADLPRFLSFLLVTVDRTTPNTGVTVTPVFLDDLKDLYRLLPAGTIVDVAANTPPPAPGAVLTCLQDGRHSSHNLAFQL